MVNFTRLIDAWSNSHHLRLDKSLVELVKHDIVLELIPILRSGKPNLALEAYEVMGHLSRYCETLTPILKSIY